jgi:hypothetical protein
MHCRSFHDVTCPQHLLIFVTVDTFRHRDYRQRSRKCVDHKCCGAVTLVGWSRCRSIPSSNGAVLVLLA